MNWVVMGFLLLTAAALQAVVPARFFPLGQPPPFMLGLVIYYSLTRPVRFALVTALVAGLIRDSLSLVPLGYSSFCFCVTAWFVNRVRGDVFTHQPITWVLTGAVSGAGMFLVMAMLLVHAGLIADVWQRLIGRTVWAAVLGAVTVPLVSRAAEAIDARLGLIAMRNVRL